jgi:hypothetical protein
MRYDQKGFAIEWRKEAQEAPALRLERSPHQCFSVPRNASIKVSLAAETFPYIALSTVYFHQTNL